MSSKGFTLIELLVVIGIVMVLAGSSVPLYSLIRSDDQLDSTKQMLLADLYLMQEKAKAGLNGNVYGVRFRSTFAHNGKYVLLEGNNIAIPESSFDRIVSEDLRLTLNYVDNEGKLQIGSAVFFEPYTGIPYIRPLNLETFPTGTIRIKYVDQDQTEEIVITETGLMY